MGIFCRATWGNFVIPIQLQLEPPDFAQKVRDPGLKFLAGVPTPQGKDAWKSRDYWRKALNDLYVAYGHICAYTAIWIPKPAGIPTVDHFIPKSIDPGKAYEWSNFRLACHTVNTWKASYQDVLDPFHLGDNWFVIDFYLLEVKPNLNLDSEVQEKVCATISRLRLNGPECRGNRENWFNEYCSGNITFNYLKRRAPFIAYELERQKLAHTIIASMAKVRKPK